MKYNRSEIMKRAHKLHEADIFMASRGHETPTFADRLRQAWAEAKKANMVQGWKIPNWLMVEKEVWGVAGCNGFAPDNQIVKESKKAFCFLGVWFPKSVCERVSRK